MGTVNFTLTRRDATRELASSDFITSGAHTSSTSASYAEDGTGDITVSTGDVLEVTASEDGWLDFGADAVVGTGFFMPAGVMRYIAVDRTHNGAKVSVIDVA